MPDRVQLKAEEREILGKKVRRLRRAGILPATVYGHRVQPTSVQVDAHEFRDVLRRAGTTQLIDLVVGAQAPRPVLVRQTTIDPRRNSVIHVEFFQANLREKITTHVPLHVVGDSPAAREGGIQLQVLDHGDIESLPQDVPAEGVTVDVGGLTEFNAAIHAADLQVPPGVTLLTSPEDVVVKVNPPVSEAEVEEYVAATEPLPAELGGDEQPPDAVPEA